MKVIHGAELKALMAKWRKEGLSPPPRPNPAVRAMFNRARRAFLPPPWLRVVK
jgi:hypothetical protein